VCGWERQVVAAILKRRFLIFLLTALYGAGFALFYYRYVPLVLGFQAVFVPILLATLILTASRLERGILFFTFAFPLVNILPYLFGIYGHIPHAPAALVLVLALAGGWLLNSLFSGSPRMPVAAGDDRSIFRPLVLLGMILFISGLITFFRYTNFFPLRAEGITEWIVNDNLGRTGGALMSVVFSLLSYLSGFFYFLLLLRVLRLRETARKILTALGLAVSVSLVFGLVQGHCLPSLGNVPYWVKIGQVNATFKDPNSLGVCLVAFTLLFLGAALSAEGKIKIWFAGLALLSLYLVPFSGSRSPVLGLALAGPFFLILARGGRKKSPGKNWRKSLVQGGILTVVLIAVLLLSVLSRKASLYYRIEKSQAMFSIKNSPQTLFTGKLPLWRVALAMIRDYPLTGVGLGAYIIELPNYGRMLDIPLFKKYPDSAENYLLQAGAELGLTGLCLFLWLFYGIVRRIRRKLRETAQDGCGRFILIGVSAGIVSIFVNFLFHSYSGSYEVQYVFWLLAALLVAHPSERGEEGEAGEKEKKKPAAFNRSFVAVALALALIFGGVHFWNSIRSLSINARTEKFGWNQDFGFYGNEVDARGVSFRWAKKKAGISLPALGPVLVLPLIVSHPDVARRPVSLKVYTADKFFRKGELVRKIVFREKGWRDYEFLLSGELKTNVSFIFETNRTWQPSKCIRVPDARNLAVGLGQPWFRYSSEPKVGTEYETRVLGPQNWAGEFGASLFMNGESHITYQAQEGDFALRIRLRGQKALGIGPYIIVRLNGKLIARTMLKTEDWTSFVFYIKAQPGENVLSVAFTNDLHRPDLGQDRNLYLDTLEILSKGAPTGSRRLERLEENDNIQPQGPVSNVVLVQVQPFSERKKGASAYLP
jgi:O-antigen ligase